MKTQSFCLDDIADHLHVEFQCVMDDVVEDAVAAATWWKELTGHTATVEESEDGDEVLVRLTPEQVVILLNDRFEEYEMEGISSEPGYAAVWWKKLFQTDAVVVDEDTIEVVVNDEISTRLDCQD